LLEYKIQVRGYAAERNLFRQEVTGTKSYGLQTETTQRNEYTETDATAKKEKEETKKKKKDVVAFPETKEEIKEIISQEAPFRIAGMFKAISKTITPRHTPPKGRRGVTKPLEIWDIELSDIDITDIQRTQFLQLHGNVGSPGSTLEYGDHVDFMANMSVWTPALDYKDTEELIRRIVKLSRLVGFGPFRHARMYFT